MAKSVKEEVHEDRLDVEKMSCLVWLLLQKLGGRVTFTEKELAGMTPRGRVVIENSSDQMTIKAIDQ